MRFTSTRAHIDLKVLGDPDMHKVDLLDAYEDVWVCNAIPHIDHMLEAKVLNALVRGKL